MATRPVESTTGSAATEIDGALWRLLRGPQSPIKSAQGKARHDAMLKDSDFEMTRGQLKETRRMVRAVESEVPLAKKHGKALAAALRTVAECVSFLGVSSTSHAGSAEGAPASAGMEQQRVAVLGLSEFLAALAGAAEAVTEALHTVLLPQVRSGLSTRLEQARDVKHTLYQSVVERRSLGERLLVLGSSTGMAAAAAAAVTQSQFSDAAARCVGLSMELDAAVGLLNGKSRAVLLQTCDAVAAGCKDHARRAAECFGAALPATPGVSVAAASDSRAHTHGHVRDASVAGFAVGVVDSVSAPRPCAHCGGGAACACEEEAAAGGLAIASPPPPPPQSQSRRHSSRPSYTDARPLAESRLAVSSLRLSFGMKTADAAGRRHAVAESAADGGDPLASGRRGDGGSLLPPLAPSPPSSPSSPPLAMPSLAEVRAAALPPQFLLDGEVLLRLVHDVRDEATQSTCVVVASSYRLRVFPLPVYTFLLALAASGQQGGAGPRAARRASLFDLCCELRVQGVAAAAASDCDASFSAVGGQRTSCYRRAAYRSVPLLSISRMQAVARSAGASAAAELATPGGGGTLVIRTTDLRLVTLSFAAAAVSATALGTMLAQHTWLERPRFPHDHARAMMAAARLQPAAAGGRAAPSPALAPWGPFSFEGELRRLLQHSPPRYAFAYRLCGANAAYALCPSYPEALIVPAAVSDAVVAAAARYRSSARGLAVTWFCGSVCLSRGSQPLAGLLSKRSAADEALVAATRADPQQRRGGGGSAATATAGADGGAPGIASGVSLLILDARPRMNALGNVAKGGGSEVMAGYPQCALHFLGIDNIHAVRDALAALKVAVAADFQRSTQAQMLQSKLHEQALLAAYIAAAGDSSGYMQRPPQSGRAASAAEGDSNPALWAAAMEVEYTIGWGARRLPQGVLPRPPVKSERALPLSAASAAEDDEGEEDEAAGVTPSGSRGEEGDGSSTASLLPARAPLGGGVAAVDDMRAVSGGDDDLEPQQATDADDGVGSTISGGEDEGGDGEAGSVDTDDEGEGGSVLAEDDEARSLGDAAELLLAESTEGTASAAASSSASADAAAVPPAGGMSDAAAAASAAAPAVTVVDLAPMPALVRRSRPSSARSGSKRHGSAGSAKALLSPVTHNAAGTAAAAVDALRGDGALAAAAAMAARAATSVPPPVVSVVHAGSSSSSSTRRTFASPQALGPIAEGDAVVAAEVGLSAGAAAAAAPATPAKALIARPPPPPPRSGEAQRGVHHAAAPTATGLPAATPTPAPQPHHHHHHHHVAASSSASASTPVQHAHAGGGKVGPASIGKMIKGFFRGMKSGGGKRAVALSGPAGGAGASGGDDAGDVEVPLPLPTLNHHHLHHHVHSAAMEGGGGRAAAASGGSGGEEWAAAAAADDDWRGDPTGAGGRSRSSEGRHRGASPQLAPQPAPHAGYIAALATPLVSGTRAYPARGGGGGGKLAGWGSVAPHAAGSSLDTTPQGTSTRGVMFHPPAPAAAADAAPVASAILVNDSYFASAAAAAPTSSSAVSPAAFALGRREAVAVAARTPHRLAVAAAAGDDQSLAAAAAVASRGGVGGADAGGGTSPAAGPSEWLRLLSILLAGARKTAGALAGGVSVALHCSDGWDRTAQVSALAQLLLDPHARTLEGFACLVEKEWCAFGHRFGRRCGTGGCGHDRADHADSQRAPVFLQWLDAVWQCWRQCPAHFQFNERLLVALAQHAYSGRYGSFLHDCEKARASAGVFAGTAPFWPAVLGAAGRPDYTNAAYCEGYGLAVGLGGSDEEAPAASARGAAAASAANAAAAVGAAAGPSSGASSAAAVVAAAGTGSGAATPAGGGGGLVPLYFSGLPALCAPVPMPRLHLHPDAVLPVDPHADALAVWPLWIAMWCGT